MSSGRGFNREEQLLYTSQSTNSPRKKSKHQHPQNAPLCRCMQVTYVGEMARHAVIVTPASGNIRWPHPFHDHQPGKREVSVTQLPTVPRWRHLVVPYRLSVMQASADKVPQLELRMFDEQSLVHTDFIWANSLLLATASNERRDRHDIQEPNPRLSTFVHRRYMYTPCMKASRHNRRERKREEDDTQKKNKKKRKEKM
jgi:hypothetical protein